MNAHEPVVHPVGIGDLRPTQVTLGFQEVARKRERFAAMNDKAGGHFLGRHMLPAVIGPKQRRYLIDNHHLARALQEEGVEQVLVSVVADLSALTKDSFWRFLDNRDWCHTYDENGVRVDFDAIPTSLAKMRDDPYRSLAGELRHAGGYAKDMTPFSEFLWADFLRTRIKPKSIAADFDKALKRAVALARSKDAAFLPGWCGPDPTAPSG